MRSPGLAIDWTKHVSDPEKKSDLEKTIRHSTVALSRLREILSERLKMIASMETRLDEYNSASWSHKQAHRNGQCSALKDIHQLLSFLDHKEP